MIQTGQYLKRISLIIGDLIVFQIALVITVTIRHGGFDQAQWSINAWPFFVLSLLWVVAFFIVGLYDLSPSQEPIRLLRTYLEGMIVNLGIALGFFYLIPFWGIAPRTILFLQFSVAVLLGYFWRLCFGKFILGKMAPGRVAYIGPAEDVRDVEALLRSSSLGYQLAFALPTSGEPYRHGEIKWLPDYQSLDLALAGEKIGALVVGARPDEHPELKAALYRALSTSVAILDRAEIEEAATGRIPLTHVSETWFLQHLNESEKAWYETAKRGADILLAIPVGLVTLAIIPFVFVLTKLTSPGPILYSQIRVGKGGKPFRIWKFRTMVVDSEKNGAQFTANAKTDPRLFPWGKFMRRTRIDEFPQVWNVLRGDLSFIGPRPERPEFVEPLIERMPFYSLRHLTRPGLTGWAQVKFLTPNASIEDNLKKLQYDLYYIKHRSPILDLVIILRTVGVMLRRQGT